MEEFMRVYDNPEVPNMDDYTPDEYDPHIGMHTAGLRGE